MNVSALLQESPSGDLRNRQQAQKQQQQQLQRQVTPQPQQTHDRRTSFDSVRDHDQKDREREREPDLHRNRASSIPSRSQIDLSFPISNSMSKLNQPSHGQGLGIGYPNDHPSSRASHHQLPPPSSFTGDLPDPGSRLPPPRDQPPPFPPREREREPPPPFHSHHERPPPPPSSGQQAFGIDSRHHSSHPRPPDRSLPLPFMPPPLDYPADRNLKPLPKPINAHPGGSHPLFPTTVTPRQSNGPPSGYPSRPKSPVSSNYSEQSSMFDGHHLPLPPPPPPSHSQHPRSRTSIIGQSSHPASNRSSPAMGSLPRLDDHLPHPQNVGAQISQSGNHVVPGSSLTGLHNPSSSSSPRTQNKMTTGPAAPALHNPGYFAKSNGSPTREQREREREYERWERDRDWERERERSREIMQVERAERNSRGGSARGVPGYPDSNGGHPRQNVSREERERERHRERMAVAEREREMQMRREVESSSGFLSRVGPPTQRNEHPPNDHVLSRSQQQTHPSHLQPHHNNPQQSHLGHGGHHHHHHHHHPRGSSKGKNKDPGSHRNQNINPIVVVEPHHQHSIPHRPPAHYNEPPYKSLPSPKTGPNDLPIPSMNGPGLSPLDHFNHHIYHNQRNTHLHHSQSLPILPPPSIVTRPPSPQISHPIHLFPPSAPESLVPGVHLGVFVYPRLPFPFFDFPEKVIVNVDKDGVLVPDEVLVNESNDPAKAAMLEDMMVLEKEVDREVRATVILPCGLIYDELPTMFSKGESGWKGLNLWGGGIIPRGGTTPAEAQSSGPTIGGRRVYTDDSDLALCVLHSGFVNMGGMKKAKANKMSMKIEVKLSREGRFVGGFGAAYHGGHPEKEKDGGLDGMNGAGGTEEDGRRMLSGGWGNGHDGAGLEILAVEFIQGLSYSGGLWNRKQRLKEYAERRLVVCQSSLPSVGKRKRAQCRRLATLGGKPYRGLDSRAWYDIIGDDSRWMDNNSLVFSQSGSPTFKYNPVALKSVLLPPLLKDDQVVSRSRKRQRLDFHGVSTNPNAPEGDLEYGVVLETSKERFLVVRHGKIAQAASADGANGVDSDKPMFTISLIQGEVKVAEGVPTSSPTPTMKLEELTPVPVEEEPKSPLPAPEQPTKEPSPVEPLPPVSIPQELEVAQGLGRGRSTSVVDMELDTPVSVTPTATAGPDIPIVEKTLPNRGVPELGQDVVLQNAKPTADDDQSQPEGRISQEGAPSTEKISVQVEAIPSKPPSPTSATSVETARLEVPPLTSIPVPQPEVQGPPQVKFKLQVLQRNVREEDLVFGDDGLGVLSADVDSLDNTKKGWLIEAPRWRRYDGRISDSIVVD